MKNLCEFKRYKQFKIQNSKYGELSVITSLIFEKKREKKNACEFIRIFYLKIIIESFQFVYRIPYCYWRSGVAPSGVGRMFDMKNRSKSIINDTTKRLHLNGLEIGSNEIIHHSNK